MDTSPLAAPKVAALVLLAAVAIPVSAHAQQMLTFALDGAEGVSSFTETVSGVTLTLSNPNNGTFTNPGTGIVLGAANQGGTTTFNFTLSATGQVVSYVAGSNFQPESGSFSLSIAGVTTSTGNDLSTPGSHTLAGTFLLPAGSTGLLTATEPTNDFGQLGSVTFLVPEPRTWTLLGLGGFLAFALSRWRRVRGTRGAA